MKVNAYKTVEVECEVEVSLDDCINEMMDIANNTDGVRRKLSAIDGATKILAKIGPEYLDGKGRLTIIGERLSAWILYVKNNS